MYKMTNVEELGTTYTVSDSKGQIIKSIQIIPHIDILESAIGEYTEAFGSFTEYLQKSVEVLEGFELINPKTVLWYATSEEEVVLADIIEYAVKNGYDRIILEHLEPLE